MTSIAITPKRIEFLRLLSRMGFASTRHLAESGLIVNAMDYSQSVFFRPMLDQLLIGRITVVSPYGIGKRVMYYLTKKGAEFLGDTDDRDSTRIRFVPLKGGVVSAADGGTQESIVRTDFPHKEAYVSTLISLERYLSGTEYEIVQSKHYYDRKAGLPTFSVGGRSFRPDGLVTARAETPGKPDYSFVIELHRHSDRKKIIAQLYRHVEAYRSGALSQHFGEGKPYFVLSVYAAENVGAMRHVIDTLKLDTEAWPYFERFFLFAELESLRSDFYSACAYFGGPKKPLPPISVR